MTIPFVQPNVIGAIVAWEGAIVDIPNGWALCNGANGTPDLRDRFIPGAGSTYAVGANGGGVQHNHDFTGPGHSHTIPADAAILGTGPFVTATNVEIALGTTDNGSSLPQYYSLAYIMFTGG